MILVETGDTSGVVVAKAVGTVSATDYSEDLIPGLEAAIAAHGPVAMLYWFGPDSRASRPGPCGLTCGSVSII